MVTHDSIQGRCLFYLRSWPAICVLPHRRYFRSEAQIPVAATRTSSPSPSGSSTSTTSTEGGALRTAFTRCLPLIDPHSSSCLEPPVADLSQGLAVVMSALLVAESAACGSSLSWVARDVAGVVM